MGMILPILPLHKRALRGIGYLVSRKSSIFKELTVEENLMLAAEVSIDDENNDGKGLRS